MDDAAGIPLLEDSRTPPPIRKIVDATGAACGELLLTADDNGTWMDPEAAETVLGLIGIWGIPVLDPARLDTERTWLWADLHLRDAASVRCHRRPFWCRPAHDRALRRRWRHTIAPADLTIHAGDFAPESVGERHRRALLDAVPGRKINIVGNHDAAALHAPLTDGWDASFGALVIASDPPLVVTHCPLRTVPPGSVNVHGHMHRRRDRSDDPRINIAVEQTGYHPVRASALVTEAARRLAGHAPRSLDAYRTATPSARNGRETLTGWIVPVTDRTRAVVRVCAACERRDPHMVRIEDRDAGVHAAPWDRWRRTEIDACEHPGHAEAHHD